MSRCSGLGEPPQAPSAGLTTSCEGRVGERRAVGEAQRRNGLVAAVDVLDEVRRPAGSFSMSTTSNGMPSRSSCFFSLVAVATPLRCCTSSARSLVSTVIRGCRSSRPVECLRGCSTPRTSRQSSRPGRPQQPVLSTAAPGAHRFCRRCRLQGWTACPCPLPPTPRPALDVLSSLDPDQRAAAEAVRGPVCILAGAGTGKTRTITHRIAHAVLTGTVDAEGVLAVTFTARAAGELRGRLRALGCRRGPGAHLPRGGAAPAQLLLAAGRSGGEPPRLVESKLRLVAEAVHALRCVSRCRPPSCAT